VAAVALPHDWLTWRLLGTGRLEDLATDRSDASGTGYFDTAGGVYDRALLDLALRRDASAVVLPRVLGPDERAGTTPGGIVLGPGCGDNAGAALGLGMTAGDISVSIGTSGVVAAVTDTPVADPTGTLTGFADATGRFLPLAVTLNGSQTMDVMRGLLAVDFAEYDSLALAAEPGAGGLTLVPYYQGERTPNLPHATGSVLGMTMSNLTRENLARASVEGLLCGLADGLEAFVAQGVPVERVRLIGGGARARAVQEIAPAVLGRDVLLPEPGEYVADGAARQAAWVLTGTLPTWETSATAVRSAPATPQVREAYADRRDLWVER
ncbi:MAG: xylulose kinase, partial [Actinobacteria bacterium]|nr:xylulose kinase [Actinomycetota bacterium]